MNRKEVQSPIVAGNWKLNKNLEETEQFIEQFSKLIVDEEARKHFLILPPALNITKLVGSMKFHQAGFPWGAQNVCFQASGAFTGENSAAVIQKIGGSFALVGHSERRTLFGETDLLLAKKVKHVQEVGLTPILCVGESLEQREKGESQQVVLQQVQEALQFLDPSKILLWLTSPFGPSVRGKLRNLKMPRPFISIFVPFWLKHGMGNCLNKHRFFTVVA